MTTAAVMIAPKEDIATEAASAEVLKHCPYHNQIIAFRAARDTFIES